MSRPCRLLSGCCLLLVLLCAATSLAASGALPLPDPMTVAESSEFRATSRHADVAALVDQLVDSAPHVRRLDFGRSVDGRPLIAAIASQPPLAALAATTRDPRLRVLLLANTQADECAGKEALLMLLREVAQDSQHRWLENLVLIVVPNLNVDGNERIGKKHGQGQGRPERGAGLRENAQDLDLDRDFVKLECPETRCLVQLIQDWDPHLLINTHTGSGQHRYRLTYITPRNPAVPQRLRRFLREHMLPEVAERMAKQGIDTFPSGSLDAQRARWIASRHEPRHGLEYMGLRGRLAIQTEASAALTYRERIEVTRQFVSQCLAYLATHHRTVRGKLKRVRQRTVAAGRQPRPNDQIPIAARAAAWPGKRLVKGYAAAKTRGDKSAAPRPQDYQVEFYGRFEPTARVPRPFAYLIAKQHSRVADRLRMHGIQLDQLTAEVTQQVQVDRATRLTRQTRPEQHHRLVTVEVERRVEQRTLAAGTYVVLTAQPLGNLAAYLLEPNSDDALVRWNFFDHCFSEGDDYPVTSVALATPLATQPLDRVVPAQQLDLDQLYGKQRVRFGGRTPQGLRWLPGSSHYLRQLAGRTVRVEAESGAVERYEELGVEAQRALAKLPSIRPADAEQMVQGSRQRSPHGKAWLFSFAGDLFFYDAASKQAQRLTHTPAEERFPTFSPDGRQIAFVRQHNLLVVDTQTGATRPLTVDGSEQLLHGELDWVYQEEVYGRGNYRAFWWSPDSRRIAFLRLDEQAVHSYTVADHIPYRQSLKVTRYPKAGDPLPRVSLGVVPAAGGTICWIDQYAYSSAEHLIVRVGWTADGTKLVYQVQNRPQTWLDLCLADPISGKSTVLLRESSPAWVNVLGQPHWLKDGSFLWLSERSGYRHLYHVSSDAQQVRPLTSGSWSVASLVGVDEKNRWAYFLAAKETPTAAQAYRLSLDGGPPGRITAGDGHHTVRFNDDYRFFIDYTSGVHQPQQVRLYRADGSFIRSIEPNLVDYLKYYAVAPPQNVRFQARDGAALQAMLIRPPDFDPNRKYPVLCYVYSGPQSPVVRDRWAGSTYLWHQLLAQKGYCVWLCDNRSARSQGVRDAWPIHRQLGKHELQDIEDGVDWLCQQTWVDPQRIGIWGWSYGGYMTSYAMTHCRLFKMGMAGAPVTDWRNYDAIYTERYMDLPQNNEQGYRRSSVVSAAADLHGRLLLLHGTNDDNVHLANTLQLAYALQQAGKQFELMIYPKNQHGIHRGDQLRHLRQLMTDFVLDHL